VPRHEAPIEHGHIRAEEGAGAVVAGYRSHELTGGKIQILVPDANRLVAHRFEGLGRYLELDFRLASEPPHLVAGIEGENVPTFLRELLNQRVTPCQSSLLVL
jgi:hypothetical protein